MIALWIFGWVFIGWLGVFGFNRIMNEEVRTEDIPPILIAIAFGPISFTLLVGVLIYEFWDRRRYKVSTGWLAVLLGGKRVKNDVNSLY